MPGGLERCCRLRTGVFNDSMFFELKLSSEGDFSDCGGGGGDESTFSTDDPDSPRSAFAGDVPGLFSNCAVSVLASFVSLLIFLILFNRN